MPVYRSRLPLCSHTRTAFELTPASLSEKLPSPVLSSGEDADEDVIEEEVEEEEEVDEEVEEEEVDEEAEEEMERCLPLMDAKHACASRLLSTGSPW